jgi:hypothetical protein
MDENVKTFSLCSNQRKLISRMNAEQKAELLDALFAFNDGEEVSVDDPLVDTVFMVMVETIERMRKFAAQKKANGQKGGRPKGGDNQDNDDGENIPPNESNANQEKPNKTKNNQNKPNESNANQEKAQYQYQYGVNTPLSPKGDIPPRGEQPAKKRRKEEPPRQAYGQFQQVMLTEDEHSKLEAEFGIKGAQDMIDRLDGYIASKGVKYKNHYATIMNWHRKDVKEEQQQQAQVPALPQGVPRFSNYGQQVKWDQQQQARALLAVGDKYKDNPEDIPPEWR